MKGELMKMHYRDYLQLSTAIGLAIANHGGLHLDTYRKQGLSDERFRWDCFWVASDSGLLPTDWRHRVNAYCNDDHIDTALRQITETT